MGIPDGMLPQTVTRIRPSSSTNTYGDTAFSYIVPPATSTTMAAWLQQNNRTEEATEGRAPLDQRWLLITNDSDVEGHDRIVWGALTFEVDGPPAPVYTPGGYHHTEATLKVVEG
jgi:hypothetical protein